MGNSEIYSSDPTTITLKRKSDGKLYLLASADEYILDDVMQHKNLMLIHTGARDSNGRLVKEFKVRTLSEWEQELTAEEVLASLPYVKFKGV